MSVPIKISGKILALVLGGMVSMSAYAGLITVTFGDGPPPANDCSGVFGQGFNNCAINGSPIIAKFETEEGLWEVNSLFPSIDTSEFSASGTMQVDFGEDATGSWFYTPGPGDPGIRYWVAKGGNIGFNLFYVVPDSADGACAGSASTTCLDMALVQTTGSYSVPSGGLSHISFYDTAPTTSVPEPATFALLGLGLGLIGLRRRARG